MGRSDFAGDTPALSGSSINNLIDGVQVSSNCPLLTAHTNPTNAAAARPRLAKMRKTRMLMTIPLKIQIRLSLAAPKSDEGGNFEFVSSFEFRPHSAKRFLNL